MCVIIIKNPGVTIPKPMIDSACHVNPDGFGITVIKKGEAITFKNYDKLGNSPEEVYRIMTEYNDLQQFIHLRFTTKGAKHIDNCHPFRLIDQETFSLDLMHNGTLYDFDPKDKDDRSDTRIFAEEFATPLAEAFFSRNGNEMLQDPVYQQIMEKYSGNGYLVSYDNNGNFYVAGGKGKMYEGWWASNTYSFDRAHREPKSSTTTYYGSNYTGRSSSFYGTNFYEKDEDEDGGNWSKVGKSPPWGHRYTRYDGAVMEWNYTLGKYCEVGERKALPAPSASTTTASSSSSSSASVAGPTVADDNNDKEKETDDNDSVPFRELFPNGQPSEQMSYQSKLLGYALAEAKRKQLAFADHVPPSKRVTFLELSGLSSLEDVCLLAEEEIEDMVTELPEAAVLLIMDLLHELYVSKRPTQRQAA